MNDLKFMGIPLDGTITNFQAKLVQKGFKPDSELNKVLDVGVRAFTGGTFYGEKADIAVWYNPKTKIVYSAKVIIESQSENKTKNLLSSLGANIREKYDGRNTLETDREHGQDCHRFEIYSDVSLETLLGLIYVYAGERKDYPYNQPIFLEYCDYISAQKDREQDMEDL